MSASPALPADLQVHPSRWCQLQCQHCYTSSGPDERGALPGALVVDAVRSAAGLGFATLSVSGGEPLLYRDLAAVLAAGRDSGLLTSFTTNALGLSARRIAALAPVTDLFAISLDGVPQSHDRMRGRRGAFDLMRSRLPDLRSAGVPFGFIATLTQHNVHELEWLVDFAASEGASQLQVHPLDGQGRAVQQLAGARPDTIELAMALLATAATAPPGLRVLVDVTRRDELLAHPAAFAAAGVPEGRPLGHWLTSLVLEPDGWLSPLGYGVDRRWGLGSLHAARLPALAARWLATTADDFAATVAAARSAVLATETPVFLWTEALRHLLTPAPAPTELALAGAASGS